MTDTSTTDPAEVARRERLMRSPSVFGYADLRSVRAGDRIRFFVSSADDREFDARLVRLTSPDIGPIGPRFKETPVESPLEGRHPGRFQPIHIGSYAHVPGPLPLIGRFTFEVLVHPTLVEDERTIAHLHSAGGADLIVEHGRRGARVRLVMGTDEVSVVGPRLTERAWTKVAVTVDLAGGALELRTTPLPAAGALPVNGSSQTTNFAPLDAAALANSSLTLAASPAPARTHHLPESCFNGRLEAPVLVDHEGATIGSWDFAADLTTQRIRDVSGAGNDGTLHNMPTRGVRGHAWTGAHLTWMADPDGYAAIHFHDTDLADAGWEPSLELVVPHELMSGCYAVRLQPADDSTPEFYVPFFVRPAAGAPHADIAFIAPTTTYGAYANMHLRVTAQFNELAHGRLTVLDSTDFLLLRMPELGRSTYDVHRDGSPVVYSSMSRPVTNFRPTGRMYKLCLDLMILDWLDAKGYRVDIVSDDDIDREGIAALAPYRVAITASHPEYISHNEYDALEEFLGRGGRLMYLGGNGFYSAAEIPPDRPDIVEVRRPGQDNLWRVNHAEAASSTSGRPTGMWRNIGRPENTLTGVGFITQGFDACTYYVRSEASSDPRVSWIFDGLAADEKIGDFGILMGGAAGYELDRHDITKGSPTHSVVVASSGGHSNLYDLMVSSILDTLPDAKRTQDPIRADMVFFETGHGGAVFSVGSIAWAGSLTHDGYSNSVSTVTANVLDRFADPAPFEPPPAP